MGCYVVFYLPILLSIGDRILQYGIERPAYGRNLNEKPTSYNDWIGFDKQRLHFNHGTCLLAGVRYKQN